jgi:hypothetical protein
VLFVEPEFRRAMHHQLVHLFERPRVEEDVQPLPRRQLAPVMLRFDALRAAAEARLILHLQQALEPVFVRHAQIVSEHRR